MSWISSLQNLTSIQTDLGTFKQVGMGGFLETCIFQIRD